MILFLLISRHRPTGAFPSSTMRGKREKVANDGSFSGHDDITRYITRADAYEYLTQTMFAYNVFQLMIYNGDIKHMGQLHIVTQERTFKKQMQGRKCLSLFLFVFFFSYIQCQSERPPTC